jgi:curved DNA-binding protein CbpA
MLNWFAHCTTTEEIKKEYRRLAYLHHPDRSGDTATMQEINAAYAFAMKNATRSERPGRSEAEYATMDTINERIRAAVEAAVKLPDLEIEICGLWVWVSGNTRPVKDALKEAGYQWAPKKARWYFAGIPSRSRGDRTMEEIRALYGSEIVKSGRTAAHYLR